MARPKTLSDAVIHFRPTPELLAEIARRLKREPGMTAGQMVRRDLEECYRTRTHEVYPTLDAAVKLARRLNCPRGTEIVKMDGGFVIVRPEEVAAHREISSEWQIAEG